MRILLIEDDEHLGSAVKRALSQEGNTVDWLKDGLSAEQATVGNKEENFDLLVLDLGLPRLDGLELLKRIRRSGNKCPVLILTARATVEDRIAGLDTGADDYLTKPFELDELLARIRALLRRSSGRAEPEISYQEIVIRPASYSVIFKGEPVTLPRREFSLLQKLLENVGRAISREQLNQTMYGWEEHVDSNALEVHIHNLRKKFGNELIHTIRGVGYMVGNPKDVDL